MCALRAWPTSKSISAGVRDRAATARIPLAHTQVRVAANCTKETLKLDVLADFYFASILSLTQGATTEMDGHAGTVIAGQPGLGRPATSRRFFLSPTW